MKERARDSHSRPFSCPPLAVGTEAEQRPALWWEQGAGFESLFPPDSRRGCHRLFFKISNGVRLLTDPDKQCLIL